MLDLTQHLDRKPANLSGGQRQRVAMGRAIVRDPAAFLMDEPLSNLDAKLRVQMRTEVSRIQQRLGTTTVYVTHDQTEAMTLGDRVAVMRSGVLQQVGTPMDLYNNPKNLFVAGFIGSPAMNFMAARIEGDTLKLPMADVRLPEALRGKLGKSGGDSGQVIAGIRPEDFEDAHLVGDRLDRGTKFKATIDLVESMGSELYAHFSVVSEDSIESDELRELAEDSGAGEVPSAGGEGEVVARLDPASKVERGKEAELWVDASKVKLFDPKDGRSLTAEAASAARRPRERRAVAEGRDPAASDAEATRSGRPGPRAAGERLARRETSQRAPRRGCPTKRRNTGRNVGDPRPLGDCRTARLSSFLRRRTSVVSSHVGFFISWRNRSRTSSSHS